MRPLTQHQPKIRASKLLDSSFSDIFAEIEIRFWKTFKFGPGRFLERLRKFQPKYDYL